MNHSIRKFLGVLLFLCGSPLIYAQTAALSGTIVDPSGSGVPDAKVTAKNLGNGASRTASTDSSGSYSVPNLPVGQYDVIVEKPGFEALQFHNVTLSVAQNLTLNGSLVVGAVTQSVDVAGAAVPAINLEDAQLSNLVDQRRIVELPLITRDPYSLVLLSPGTQQTSSSLGGFSVNGQRERNNNFMLDGVDNNDASVPGGPGGLSTINPDATQEFRVITNNFLPEFGRNTGAVVDIITKAGTNSFHGDGYEFNRVRALAARDFFNPTPEPQNPFVRNQFGASFGGPIVKDKTFFFVNGEWDRYRTTITNQSVVPNAAFKSGNFNYTETDPNTGNPVTVHINLADPNSPDNVLGLPLNPAMQKLFAAYPLPNGPAVDSLRGTYYFPTSEPVDSANVTFRLDHRFNDKYSVYARYIYNGFESGNTTDEIFPGVAGIQNPDQTHNLALNFIANLRPDLVNEFRVGVNRIDEGFFCNGQSFLNQFSQPDAFGNGTDYSFNLSNRVNTIANLGCNGLADSDGQAHRDGTWDVRDHVSMVYGNHTVKFGVEYNYVFSRGYDAFSSRPVLDFTAYGNEGVSIVNCGADPQCTTPGGMPSGAAQAIGSDELLQTLGAALLGVGGVQTQTQFFNAQGARQATDYRDLVQHEYAGFIQDSWKIRPNLTIDFGVRYQFDGVPFETNGNLSNLLYQQLSSPGPITFQEVGPGTGRTLYYNDPTNFEPRAGLAWDPFKDGKTSVRLGYGIFHDRIFGNLISNLADNPPFTSQVQNFLNAPGASPLVVGNIATPATQPAPSSTLQEGGYAESISTISRTVKNPYTQSWNVGIQRSLGSGMSVEVDYVGSSSHRLLRSVDGNPPVPGLVAAAQASGALDPIAALLGAPSATQVSGGILRLSPLYGGPQLTGNTVFDEPIEVETVGNATYNALQVGFNKQFSHGFQFQANYTWSHAIDDAADPLVTTFGNRNVARNSFNLEEERGSSDNDLRHRLIINYIYEVPFGPGHARFSHGFAGYALGGWEVAGLSTFQSGTPFTIYSSRDSEYTGLTNRPDITGDPSIPAGSPSTQTGPPITAFSVQPYGRAGDLGRNVFTGPRYYNTDASLIKNTRFGESGNMNLQFRAEVFNVFNRVQFSQPGTSSSGNTLSDPGTFGISQTTVTQPDGTTSARQIQLALKFLF